VVQLTGTDGRAEQVAVRLQMARGSGRPTRGLGAMNRVTEVAVTASAPLRDTDRYELLWGALE
jgi:hypothetical protein